MAEKTDDATFWLIAVPKDASSSDSSNSSAPKSAKQDEEDARLTRRDLELRITKLATLHEFPVPMKLRVGTLDTLMALSDDLTKLDTTAEGLHKKIARTWKDLEKKEQKTELMVAEQSPHDFVMKFRWSEERYPFVATLRDLTTKIQTEIASLDEELRKRTTRFTEVTTALSAIERKEGGTLLVKPLGDIVKENHIIEKAFLTTLLVVIPKAKQKEFLDSYETFDDSVTEPEKKHEDKKADAHAVPSEEARVNLEKNLTEEEKRQAEMELQDRAREARSEERKKKIRSVVPGSAMSLSEDGDFILYRFVIFKHAADKIRNVCREKRFTVRTFEHNPEQMRTDADEKNRLTTERDKLLVNLIKWSEASYSDAFSAWVHIKTLRTFVESVLRYGIPVRFLAFLLKPNKGAATKLRKVLGDLYGKLRGASLTGAVEGEGDFGFGSDFYPYIYLPVNLEGE